MTGVVKYPIDTARIRRVPRQFGAIDRELVYGCWTRHLSLEALTLYVFLICVADVQGLSYYSDRRIAELLNLRPSEIVNARELLLHSGLILYQRPMYQVLDLPERP